MSPHHEQFPELPPSLLAGVMSRIEQRNSYLVEQPSQRLQALHHPQWEIRAAIVRELGTQKTPEYLDLVLAALQDEHRLVRVAAIHALGQYDNAPVEHIIVALQDRTWEVRETAILTLRELLASDRLREQIPEALLRTALQDVNSQVREAALYALESYNAIAVSVTPNAPLTQVHERHKRSFKGTIAHICTLFVRQISLVNRSVWIFTALIISLFVGLSLAGAQPFYEHTRRAELVLALISIVCAAAGTAFIYGTENDLAFELTLSTPTSIRLVMLCRFLTVILYNILLSTGASFLLAIHYASGPWQLIQLWLGPMLLVSSLTLALSLVVGSWLALLGGLLLEVSQAFHIGTERSLPLLADTSMGIWQTNALIILLAFFCLLFVIFYMPRQPRLGS